MFKVYSNTTCDVFTNMFTRVCNNINTCSNAFNFFIPRCYMDVRKWFIMFQGPSIWNNLPVNIKKSKNLHIFKVCLKKFLLNPYVSFC